MINKEIILNADGTIKKDFSDRAIPQNSNNQVSVNVLIPGTCFTGLQNYAVILGVSRIISNQETTLNSLIMTASKSITIEGVLYIKYSAILSYSYTEKIATLKFSPYIQTTATTMVGDVATEVITIQQSFTNSNLNVIKSVLPQYDASLEEGTIATTLEGQINAKKIYTFVDTDSASVGQHYYELATGYDPTADQFKGCLVMSVYGGWTNAYIPYLNNGNVELLEIIETGMFYKISDVSYADSTYTYTRTKLSYSKSEIDGIETNLQNQIDGKVDKTQKVNGHALSGDITITKGDIGLGNVANYGVESTPTSSGESLYITSKGVYDALQLVYTAISGCATDDDLTTINNRLDSIEAIIGSDDGDSDSVINTLKEVIVVLNGLGEGASLLDLINAKANQSDLTALNNQINGENGIKDKVDLLSERENAYMEIKNSLGTIDIAVSDWVENTGDTNYPYKYELTNGYLEGAVNCIVVYSKDSDTSMLSATTGIDEENGKLIIYASELPTQTISIEKIAVFNDLNAYINYSNEIVQQVNSNTSAISDINNTKLPNYIQKSQTSGLVKNDGTIDTTNYITKGSLDKGIYYTKTAPTQVVGTTTNYTMLTTNIENKNDDIGFKVGDLVIYINNDSVDSVYKIALDVATTTIYLTLLGSIGGGGSQKIIKVYHGVINQVPDEDLYYISQSDIEDNVVDLTTGQPPTSYNQGDIILEVNWNDEYNYVENMYVFNSISDGTWVGQSGDLILYDCNYINNGVKAKQLYQHNIKIDTGSTFRATIILISDNSNAFDYNSLKSYLSTNGFTSANYLLNAIGFYSDNSIYYNIFGVCTQNNEIRFLGAKDNNLGGFNITNSYNIYDNVIEL